MDSTTPDLDQMLDEGDSLFWDTYISNDGWTLSNFDVEFSALVETLQPPVSSPCEERDLGVPLPPSGDPAATFTQRDGKIGIEDHLVSMIEKMPHLEQEVRELQSELARVKESEKQTKEQMQQWCKEISNALASLATFEQAAADRVKVLRKRMVDEQSTARSPKRNR